MFNLAACMFSLFITMVSAYSELGSMTLAFQMIIKYTCTLAMKEKRGLSVIKGMDLYETNF